VSGFFSASETAMMAVNRYRLKNLADNGHRGARLARYLLDHPDQLLGTILLGNNAANIAASGVTTIIALRLFGDIGVAVAGGVLILVILIFAEVAPKTMAATYPERIALPAAYVLYALSRATRPVVWAVNQASSAFLSIFRVHPGRKSDSLSPEELRVAVLESGSHIPKVHQDMLLRILELEKITVDDVMLARSEVDAIDLDDDWEDIVAQLATSLHTRLPVYRGSLDNIVGVLHLRKVLHLSRTNRFNKKNLEKMMFKPYYVPEGTKITQHLLNLQNKRRTFSLVVDEYGDFKGLVTVEEVLEEIIGEFTENIPGLSDDVQPQTDGSYLVRGGSNIRDLNRRMGWALPQSGPKTLNGLILEHLEAIPEPGTSLMLAGHPIEVIRTNDTAVDIARIRPTMRRDG
jgi:Mg2+/Co2+ transporter CorB